MLELAKALIRRLGVVDLGSFRTGQNLARVIGLSSSVYGLA